MAGGRPSDTGVNRSEIVPVRFTPEEVRYIDDARGTQTRSSFIRESLSLVKSQRF